MAITELYNGIETVSTTEWSMTTDTAGPDADTTAGYFQMFIDDLTLAGNDEFRARIYEKVRSGGTQRVIYETPLLGVQDKAFIMPALMLMHGWDGTLLKVTGTDRSLEWSVRQVAGVTELYNGIETIGTTEWSLTTDTAGPDADTTDGVFQVLVEVNGLAGLDQFRFRMYEKVRSGGTQRLLYDKYMDSVQPGPLVIPATTLLHGWEATMVKVAGTDRSIEWSIRQAA